MRISDWSSDVCSSDLAGCATASARSNANGFAEDAPNAGARNGADIRDCVYQTLGQTFGSVSVDDRPSRVCEIEDIVTAGTHEERIYIQTVRRVADGSVVSSLVRFSIRNGHSLDRKSTRLNSSHYCADLMPASA